MKIDKNSTKQSRDVSLPTYVNLNTRLSIIPVQCQSKWKAVSTYGSNSVPFLSSGLRKKFLPLTFIAVCRQCAGDNCVDVSTVRRLIWQLKSMVQYAGGLGRKKGFFF